MLRDFLTANGPELVARCRAKVAKRRAPCATPAELESGVPLFLEQLTRMLPRSNGVERTALVTEQDEVQIEAGAQRHGDELLRHDFTIEQVVHDYGDLCQSITELAGEKGAPITVDEFGILNIRLDNAIAGAVAAYARKTDVAKVKRETPATDERLGFLAHEMRNLLNTTILAIAAIKGGGVGMHGATAAALDRSLIGMRDLIDRTLAEVRLEQGSVAPRETIEVGPFIGEVQVAAALEASQRGCSLTVSAVPPAVFVEGDRHILAAAVANLLQNAFKFTRRGSHVFLTAHAASGRVFIDVEDECGGLPAMTVEDLFRPFEQRGPDRSGAGLGLSISRKGVEAHGGTLTARDIPGRGCLFTIELPEKQWHESNTPQTMRS
jgi:signal transduction histidine kinase